MLAAAVACSLLGVTVTPRRSAPPFSWDRVPVFAETSNVTGRFDPAALQVLAKFPVFVAEKGYDYPAAGYAEDKLTVLAAQLRKLNPDIFLVFYYNANLIMSDYRMAALAAEHAPRWWLRNSSGVPFLASVDAGAGSRPPFPYSQGLHCFDHTVPEVRDMWVQECLNMTGGGGFDSCMVDRWTRTPFKGHTAGYSPKAIDTWRAAMNKSEAMLVKRARAAGIWLVGEGDEVDAHSDPGYGGGCKPNPKKKRAADAQLVDQMRLAANGQGLLASYQPGSAGQDFESQLASFLIGAGTRHYFGAGAWTCNATEREGVTWHAEYDKPLGAPLGLGQLGKDGIWRRSFASGTTVTFDRASGLGKIKWADDAAAVKAVDVRS